MPHSNSSSAGIYTFPRHHATRDLSKDNTHLLSILFALQSAPLVSLNNFHINTCRSHIVTLMASKSKVYSYRGRQYDLREFVALKKELPLFRFSVHNSRTFASLVFFCWFIATAIDREPTSFLVATFTKNNFFESLCPKFQFIQSQKLMEPVVVE